jgi:MarR family transcriptional regulator for hemolysin
VPHGLEKDPLFLLYDVARLMRTRADQRARRLGMTRAQWVILAWLELEPGLSQNELAALVEVEPITVARLIDRLEAGGFVERRADPKDRRIRRLHLLPAVAPVLKEIRAYRAELSASITSAVGEERLKQLTSSLVDLKVALIEEAQAAPSGRAAS